MRVRVGNIIAQCERCGGEEFHLVRADASSVKELVCFNCGAHTTRSTLLAQVADKTVRQARTLLERSKKHREHPGR